MSDRAYDLSVFPAQGNAADRGDAVHRIERIRDGLHHITATFLVLGEELAQAYRGREWEPLGLANFSAYCGQFNLSDSLCYDLIQIADVARSFPAQQPKMVTAGVSNLRLLLPHVTENSTADQIETLVEMANEKNWRELRRALSEADEDEPPAYPTLFCPHCGAEFEVTRATTVRRG